MPHGKSPVENAEPQLLHARKCRPTALRAPTTWLLSGGVRFSAVVAAAIVAKLAAAILLAHQ